MSLFNPLMIVGAGTLAGASGVIVFNVIRSRRAARQQARRDQLMVLARRTGLDYVGERVRSEDMEAVSWYRGESHEVSADGFLQGQDQRGRYWLARRRIADQTQDVFGFQIRGDLNLGGLWLEPVLRDPRPASWLKRILGGAATAAVASVSRWTLHREGTAEQLVDGQAAASIERWARRLVARGKVEGRVPVGLEVGEGLGWVFSPLPLDGPRTRDFLELALDLRAAVLQEIRLRPATISTPVETVSDVSDRRERVNTQPLFAVEPAEGADLGEESKTVVLSAQDLLRDMPAPVKRKSRKFEIPEPEEEVQVIWTRS